MSTNLSLDITFLMPRSNIKSLVRYGNRIESLDQMRLILAGATPVHSEASYQAMEFPLDLYKVDQGAVFPHAHSHCTVSCPAWRTDLQLRISTSPLLASLLHLSHKWLVVSKCQQQKVYVSMTWMEQMLWLMLMTMQGWLAANKNITEHFNCEMPCAVHKERAR